jgi:kynurenine 3-monooxygenase
MNCGFEDCSILDGLINQHGDDWKKILSEYQSERKPDADAIADLALNNFIEMRDKVGDPIFLLQKKIEAAFSKKYPDKWTPSYAMVTFCPHIRYSDALKHGMKQEVIMQKIMAISDIEDKWQGKEVEMMMLNALG